MLTFCYSQLSLPLSLYQPTPIPTLLIQCSCSQLCPTGFCLLHKAAEHKYALFICLLPQKATDVLVRDYNEHTNILLTHTDCWQAPSLSTGVPCMAKHTNERSGPSTSISPSNDRDTSVIQRYGQITKMRGRKNSSRCINLKALEKVKPPSLFSKPPTAATHYWV